ncbi:MAG: glycosyltransferase family protein [Verrucomicrobiota bacterium]
MTQSLAVKEMAESAGHQVVSVVLGMGPRRTVPPFFASGMKMPVCRIPTLEFRSRHNRQIHLPSTIAGAARQFPAYARALRTLHQQVRESRPDVIVNFFEPLTALFAATCRRRPPVVAVGHQFLCNHPDFVRSTEMRGQQRFLRRYVQFMGTASHKLALSFYPAADRPRNKLTVCPPLLRGRVFDLPSTEGDYVLVYLVHHGYAEQILSWHERNPAVKLHCFYDKPDAPPEFKHDETLTFHRLDGEKFLTLMAGCRAVACTAGFETLCEAAWLGRPLFLVPVENHVEQHLNALDAVRAGLGVHDTRFNLDRLAELPPRLDNQKIRDWFSQTKSIVLHKLERAVAESAPKTPQGL